ncbi:MAG: tetratricopeptide repeat protein [Candidatus Falkowbacteria bacterium]
MKQPVRIIAGLALLLLAVFLVYYPSLRNNFIYWDDYPQIINNPAAHSLGLPQLNRIFGTQIVGMYQPLSSLYYALIYQLGGANALVFHSASLALHLLNIILVFFLLLPLLSPTLALAATALFALHPAQVESVAWISASSNLLSSALMLGSLLAYRRYLTKTKTINLAVALIFGTAAIFTKPSAIILPLLWMLADWWYLGKLSWKSLGGTKIVLWFSAFLMGVATIIARMAAGHFIESFYQYSWWEKIILICDTIKSYLLTMLWPSRLSPFYPYPAKANGYLAWPVLAAPVFIALIAYLLWRLRRQRWLLLLAGWIMINLALVIRFTPVGRLYLADRYLYLPIIASAAGIVLLLSKFPRLAGLDRPLNNAGIYIFSSLLIVYGFLSLQQSQIWQDDLSLHSAAIARYPRHPEMSFVYDNLANALLRLGRVDDAKAAIDTALRLNPELGASYNNRGLIYMAYLGQPKAALADFDSALALAPDSHIYHFNKALVLAKLSRQREALIELNLAIKLAKPLPAEYLCQRAAWTKTAQPEQAARDLAQARLLLKDAVPLAGQPVFIKTSCPL